MQVSGRRWLLGILAGAGLSALSAAGPAGATPLGLTLADFPDIVSGFIDVTYDAGTGQLVASGFAFELDDDGLGEALAISGGTFDLQASLAADGSLLGGSLDVGGTVAALGFNSGTLLTGTLTAFGFPDPGGDPLEFLFEVTGGDAAALYGGSGNQGGIILSHTNFPGSFASDFDNLMAGLPGTGSAVSNTAVPEPAVLALLVSGLAGLGYYGRRRVRRPRGVAATPTKRNPGGGEW